MRQKTADHWRTQGYRMSPLESKCPACSAAVDVWVKASPFGDAPSSIVMVNPGNFEPHWSSCPEAKAFRAKQQAVVMREAGQ
jgi:hypothetical protein